MTPKFPCPVKRCERKAHVDGGLCADHGGAHYAEPKLVQLCSHQKGLHGLCDDGSVWELCDGAWKRLEALPGYLARSKKNAAPLDLAAIAVEGTEAKSE